MKAFYIIAVILVLAAASFAQGKNATSATRGERLITALVNSKTLPPIWGDDGFRASMGSPELIRIFHLGKRAFPLLIKHLDDRRVFRNMVRQDPSDPSGVTVGEGVLNLLECIVREQAPVFDMLCVNDLHRSEGSCVADKFQPGRRGKRNWTKAYQSGKVHYEKYDY